MFAHLSDMPLGATVVRTSGSDPEVYRTWLSRMVMHVTQVSPVVWDAQEPAALQAALATTFLGESCWYMVILPAQAKGKAYAAMLAWLARYQGPHRVILVGSRSDLSDDWCADVYRVVDLPERWTMVEIRQWGGLLVDHPGRIDPQFMHELFVRAQSYDFLTIRRLLAYGQLLGTRHDIFLKSWYDRIVQEPVLLYELTHHFFARDIGAFMRVWASAQRSYGPEFWIVFWSDVITRACIFFIARELGHTSGPLPTYCSRLPFSFCKKNYYKHTFRSLVSLHDRLVQGDRAIKRGADPVLLEVELGMYLKTATP